MAGTVTVVEKNKDSMRKIKWSWTSTAGGAADLVTTERYTGAIANVLFVPGGTTPTDLYDVTVTDADGYDVLNGLGANVSNAANVWKNFGKDGLGSVVDSTLTLNVTNAGNAKNGVVIVYVAS